MRCLIALTLIVLPVAPSLAEAAESRAAQPNAMARLGSEDLATVQRERGSSPS